MAKKNLHDDEEFRKETLSAYLDGDLSEDESRAVGDHLKDCTNCNEYLNSLKLVSTSLEIMLGSEPVGVPGEFSRRVTAAAESDVGSLRSSAEGSRTIMIVAILAALLVLVAGAGLSTAGPSILEFSGRSFAYLAVIGHFFYTAAIKLSMIFGTVCLKLLSGSAFAVIAVVFALILSVLVFSKHMTRFNRS